VTKYIKTISGAEFCSAGVGSYNLVVFLLLENTEALKRVIDNIKKDSAVLQINTSIWSSVEKAIARPENINLNGLLELDK
jgi:hypothetical protein